MGGGPRGVKTKSAAGSKFGRKTKTPPPVKKTVEPVAEVKIEPIKDSKYKNYSYLKERIIREKLLPYSCQVCGLSDSWQEKKLSLVLDHINGV